VSKDRNPEAEAKPEWSTDPELRDVMRQEKNRGKRRKGTDAEAERKKKKLAEDGLSN
jgi:hypothetical protein